MSAYFHHRRGAAKRRGNRRRAWPKLTAVWHTASHLILGAVTSTGPTQDSPDFTPAMRQACALVALDTVLADAAYDAEHNHRLCREVLGVRQSVIRLTPRSHGRRWPTPPYRRALRRAFPQALYHQRWHAESGFSRHKRRLGSALTTRATPAHRREIVLRVLTHNLMLLARRARKLSTEQTNKKRRIRSSWRMELRAPRSGSVVSAVSYLFFSRGSVSCREDAARGMSDSSAVLLTSSSPATPRRAAR